VAETFKERLDKILGQRQLSLKGIYERVGDSVKQVYEKYEESGNVDDAVRELLYLLNTAPVGEESKPQPKPQAQPQPKPKVEQKKEAAPEPSKPAAT